MEPLISVIIPMHNTEQYLSRCLDSILNNTYKNLEVICVDDGSTDNSFDMIHQYAEKDSRVVPIWQKNQGVSAARNTGLDHASGEFVALVDSDDWVHPEYFSELMSAQNKFDADITYCNFLQTTEICANRPINGTYKPAELVHIAHGGGVNLPLYGKRYVWGKIYRKLLIENHRFASNIRLAEDTLFNIVIIAEHMTDISVAYVQDELYYYYQRQDSLLHSTSPEKIKEVSKEYISLAEKSTTDAQQIYLIESCKTALSCRYLSMFNDDPAVKVDVAQIIKRCKALLRKARLPLKTKLMYQAFCQIPLLYRAFRIYDDHTMLAWERQQRKKRKGVQGD